MVIVLQNNIKWHHDAFDVKLGLLFLNLVDARFKVNGFEIIVFNSTFYHTDQAVVVSETVRKLLLTQNSGYSYKMRIEM